MDVEPGTNWADAVSKILRMGTNNPESNRILSKAVRDKHDSDEDNNDDNNSETSDQNLKPETKSSLGNLWRLKPDPQADALVENVLKEIATRGVVHLFNAVKTINPKSDKSKKRKKKKLKKKKGKGGGRGRRSK